VVEILYSGLSGQYWTSIPPRWANKGNCLPLVSSIDPEIGLVDRYDCVPGIELTHSDKTQIGQIPLAISIAPRQLPQLADVLEKIERHTSRVFQLNIVPPLLSTLFACADLHRCKNSFIK
jgi:hypothetical protein